MRMHRRMRTQVRFIRMCGVIPFAMAPACLSLSCSSEARNGGETSAVSPATVAPPAGTGDVSAYSVTLESEENKICLSRF
jgi:hypothetical protein